MSVWMPSDWVRTVRDGQSGSTEPPAPDGTGATPTEPANGDRAGSVAPEPVANGSAPDGAAADRSPSNGSVPNGSASSGAGANGSGANGSARETDADWAYRVADELRRQAAQRGKEQARPTAAEEDDVSDLVAEPKAADAGPAAGAEPVEAGEVPVGAGEVPFEAGEVPVEAGEVPVEAGEAPAGPVLGPDDTWSAIVAQAEALAREPALAGEEPSGTLFSDPPRAGQMFRLGRRTPPAERTDHGSGGMFRPKNAAALPVDDAPAEADDADGTSVNSGPVDGKPAASEPATDLPVDGRPVTDRPVDGRPVTDRPVDGRPVTDRRVDGRPVTDRPVDGRPVADGSAGDLPADGTSADGSFGASRPAGDVSGDGRLAGGTRVNGAAAGGVAGAAKGPAAGDGIDDPTVVVPLPAEPGADEGIDEATVVIPLPDLRAELPKQAGALAVESTLDSSWPWFAREDEPATALAPHPPAAVNGTHPEPLPRRTPKAPPADTNARTPGGPSLFEPAPRSGSADAGPTGQAGTGPTEDRPPFGGDPDDTDERLLLQRPSTTLPPASDERAVEPPNDPPLRRRPRLPDPDLPVPDVEELERRQAEATPDPADASTPSDLDPSGVDSPTEVISAMPLAAALAGVDDPTEIVARPRFDESPTEVIGPLGVGLWQEFTGELSEEAQRAIRAAGGTPATEARITPDAVEKARLRASRRASGGGGDDGDPPKATRPKDNRPPPSRGDRIRTGVRGAGQTLITLGLVVLMFVAYELWVTDLFNARTQHKLGSTLAKEWENGDDPLVGAGGGAGGPQRPGDKVARIPLGKGFANIYIPKFGLDYVYTIVEGTSPDDLNLGPGHYVGSALPGQVGNFAVAGHRVGKGSPFLNLDKLSAGDAIVIETRSSWYTYRVLPLSDGGPSGFAPTGITGIPGLQVVSPTDVDVIRPVPGSNAKPTQRLITLTTCHPKFSAKQRLIIHGVLDGAPWPKSKGDPPALKQG